MARQDALLRLQKQLLTRRSEIQKKLYDDMNSLRDENGGSTGDTVDAAFDAGSNEMASALAEMDSRELNQIERALTRLAQGTYGLCEACSERIPVGRLNALPYTTMCIECQRENERYPRWGGDRAGNWEKVYDAPSSTDEQREINLSEIEIDLSK
jgi:DnaK suppressor protein